MNRAKSCLLALAVAAGAVLAPADYLAAGSIGGRITCDVSVPKVTGDTGDCNHVGTVRTAVLVFVENAPSGGSAGSPVQIEIKNCQLRPRVVGLMTGQRIGFKNSDGIQHDLRSSPGAGGTDLREFLTPPGCC